MVGVCADATRHVWCVIECELRARQGQDCVAILDAPKTVLTHTLLKKDLALATGL